jgi:hypothetical protein
MVNRCWKETWDREKKIQNIEILSKICQETSMMNEWMLKGDVGIGSKNLKTLECYAWVLKNKKHDEWMYVEKRCENRK